MLKIKFKMEFFLGVVFLLFSLFPITPNRIKGLPVIILFLTALYLVSKFNVYKFKIKKLLFIISPFILIITSLLYTDNFSNISRTISTRLSLIIIPISFFLISSTNIKLTQKTISKFHKIYICSTAIFCLLFFLKITHEGYYSNTININDVYFIVSNNLFGIGQHPIYGSIFIAIAIFYIIQEIKNEKKTFKNILICVGCLFMLYIFFLLARKGIIISFIFALVSVYLIRFKKKSTKKLTIIFIIATFIMSLSIPVLNKRFKEVFYDFTYQNINENNSTSIRFGIYECVFKISQKKWLFGYGIGDVDDELQKCYSNKSQILVKGNFNSHNQYFSYILSSGILGAISLVSILLTTLFFGYKNRNIIIIFIILFYSSAFLFENILERQSGVILFMFFISYFNFIDHQKNLKI